MGACHANLDFPLAQVYIAATRLVSVLRMSPQWDRPTRMLGIVKKDMSWVSSLSLWDWIPAMVASGVTQPGGPRAHRGCF